MDVLNGVTKPADVIAKGTHIYIEAEHKYKSAEPVYREYPRAMYHESLGYAEAPNREHQRLMESEGWQTKPFPAKPAVVAEAKNEADLSMIVLRQREEMDKLAELVATQGRQIAAQMEALEVKRAGRPNKDTKADA